MFIQTESTTDPEVVRFLPGRAVLASGERRYGDEAEAAESPLAEMLLRVRGVREILLGVDHISVTREPGADWQVLKPPLLGVIMEHFLTHRPVLRETAGGTVAAEDPATAKIREIFETRIKPALEEECGAVTFQGFGAGRVMLGLQGAAFSMPLFAVRVKVENTLRHYVPEVESVEFVRDAPPGMESNSDGLDTPEGLAIRRLLEERINPAVAAHGGYISLVDLQDDKAFILMEGGCQGCGMADETIRQGVEAEIMQEVPSIREVVDVTDHTAGVNPYYMS